MFLNWLISKTKILIGDIKDDQEAAKIVVLRLGLISCLIAAAITTTVIAIINYLRMNIISFNLNLTQQLKML